jgi:hypothetical protein
MCYWSDEIDRRVAEAEVLAKACMLVRFAKENRIEVAGLEKSFLAIVDRWQRATKKTIADVETYKRQVAERERREADELVALKKSAHQAWLDDAGRKLKAAKLAQDAERKAASCGCSTKNKELRRLPINKSFAASLRQPSWRKMGSYMVPCDPRSGVPCCDCPDDLEVV